MESKYYTSLKTITDVDFNPIIERGEIFQVESVKESTTKHGTFLLEITTKDARVIKLYEFSKRAINLLKAKILVDVSSIIQ